MGSATICCIEQEFCCKQGQDNLMCLCCALRCTAPTTCCKVQEQVCCCVSAVAFPPDEEVPCMVSNLGINCYPKPGCLQTMEDIMATSDPGAGGQQYGS